MQKFFRFLDRGLIALGSLGLVVMTLSLCWQVFSRYVLNESPAWTEQAALILTLWFVFLGAAAGIYEGFHIRISEGVEHMNPPLARMARCFADLCVLTFAAVLIIWGSELVERTWQNRVPTLPFSRGMVYLIIPFSGAMIAAFALRGFADSYRNTVDDTP